MSTVDPPPLPSDPLSFVVKRSRRHGLQLEQLECGHRVVTSDGRRARRRRCRQCGEARAPLLVRCPECGAPKGAPCEDGGKGPLRLIAPAAHPDRREAGERRDKQAQAWRAAPETGSP